MLTIGALTFFFKIVGKIDVKPVVEKLKDRDIFADGGNEEKGALEIDREKAGELACDIIAEITPQFGRIADDLPPLVAAYKGVSVEEAVKLDAAEVINEIIHDEGITTFFKRALRKKVEQ